MSKTLSSVKRLFWISFHLQENGFQVTFTDICPGNSKCVQQIKMEFGEAQIPYTMTASSSNNSEICVEEGILYVKNSWDAKSSVTTTTLGI